MPAPETFRTIDRHFGRMARYPQDADSLRALADDLEVAARETQIAALAIAQRCAESARFCPTLAEMLEAGRQLQPPPPRPAAWNSAGPTRCTICDDTGRRLVVVTRGGINYDMAYPCPQGCRPAPEPMPAAVEPIWECARAAAGDRDES